jgi:hypothetical protein
MKAIHAAIMLSAFVAPAALAKTDWAKTPLQPDKAYILVQVDPLEVQLMGNNRVAAGVIIAPYDLDKTSLRMTQEPKKPARIDRVMLNSNPVAKDGKRRQYFALIEPGTWVIEGAGGEGGTLVSPVTAFSLSSYRFEAKAGEILDLGVMTPTREVSDNPDTKMTGGKMLGMMLAGPFGGGRVEPVPLKLEMRARQPGDLPIPAWVTEAKMVKPVLEYGATFPNLLGGLVNRVDGKAGRARAAVEAAIAPVEPAEPAVVTPAP